MAGQSLTTDAQLECPHSGKVQISGTNQRASAGPKLATDADTFSISGCQFKLPTPVPTPSPCARVIWVLPEMQVKIGGAAGLSTRSVGLCVAATMLPQGVVKVVDAGQSRVKCG